jgi:hypothetical protein
MAIISSTMDFVNNDSCPYLSNVCFPSGRRPVSMVSPGLVSPQSLSLERSNADELTAIAAPHIITRYRESRKADPEAIRSKFGVSEWSSGTYLPDITKRPLLTCLHVPSRTPAAAGFTRVTDMRSLTLVRRRDGGVTTAAIDRASKQMVKLLLAVASETIHSVRLILDSWQVVSQQDI